MADDAVSRFPHTWTALGTVGHTLSILRETACQAVVFAGTVKRPDFSQLKLDMAGMKLLPRVVNAARGGDDQLLRVLVAYFEEQGYAVIGADDVMEALLAKGGVMGACEPTPDHDRDIARARAVVTALGEHDIGQGAVVANGVVLAVEAVEGTDEMLTRCAGLPGHLRGSDSARAGVLVKMPKPGQERRIDLPVIGVRTVEGAAKAGLAGIAVEAGGALVIDRQAVVAAADKHGLFVLGFSPEERAP